MKDQMLNKLRGAQTREDLTIRTQLRWWSGEPLRQLSGKRCSHTERRQLVNLLFDIRTSLNFRFSLAVAISPCYASRFTWVFIPIG